VNHRQCSQPLQRAVTDLGADVSFGQTVAKLIEHYGITLGAETVRRIVEAHGQAIFEMQVLEEAWPTETGAEWLVGEVDGGMVPIVRSDPEQADRRKGKQLEWKEAKLCLVHARGSATPVYGGTLAGGTEEAGRQLFHCARRAGFGANSRVHSVGDGATWIAAQIEERFGDKGQFLVDFYHVCEYLAEAADSCGGGDSKRWLETQKEHLKASRAEAVLAALEPHREPPEVADESAPVRRCHRYLSNRRHQLDYAGAIRAGLPIGSGEVESSHRYITQQRLKRPGAWWTPAAAEHMLALRLCRANNGWKSYWNTITKQAA
jgi:hypothetical protein